MCNCSKAYENSDERTEKYRHLVIVDDGPLDRDSSSYSRTPSLEFSVFDSNTVTDDSNSRGIHDHIIENLRHMPMYVNMYAYMYVMYACMYAKLCMHVCVTTCMYMYVCTYVLLLVKMLLLVVDQCQYTYYNPIICQKRV